MDDTILPRPPAADAGDIGRVMVLSHTHPSISKGGAEIAAYTLFSGLREIGVDAVFVAACSERDRPRLRLDSAAERAVVADPVLYDDFYHIAAPGPLEQLRRLVAAERPAILNFHHFMNFGLNALRALAPRHGGAGARIVVTLHEFLAICHHHGQMVTRPGRHLCEAASPNACAGCFPQRTPEQFASRQAFALDVLRRAAGYVSPSAFLADRFAAWGLPRERMAVIENGLRGHAARPPAAPAPRAAERRWVFGYFGQINPFKGIDVLLKVAALIARSPDLAARIAIRIHGNIIGQSPDFIARFEETLKAYDFFEFVGPYENSAVARLMEACDYVVMPSTWWENSPVVIQEAYSVGRPVVCSGMGGMAEKVRNGISGLHFRLGDPNELLHVMQRAADPEVHAQLRAGIPAVSDSRRMAEDYVAAYRSFLAEEAPAVAAVA